MSIKLSDRVRRIKPSPTLAVTAEAAHLRAQGIDVLSLGAGEPEEDTPLFIKNAAIEALQQGFTKYTAVEGILPLRKAIVKKFRQDNQLSYDPADILVSNGGKQSFFNLTQALLNKKDEVIIPAPYWTSYLDMVLLADATPVIVEADIQQNFKITPEQLKAALTPQTRLFILNSPSNPTGIAYTDEELLSFAEVLKAYPEVLIATDDIYESIFWRKEPLHNIVTLCPWLQERTVVLQSVSKTYAMTGFRIGYAAGPRALIEAMTHIQSQSTSSPCSISQKAALAALEGDKRWVYDLCRAFKERHDFLVPALNALDGIECQPADGAFYAFPCVKKVMDRLHLKEDVAFSAYLLQEARVAVVPGSAFGAPGYLRLSYATSLENLQEALKRIKAALKA